MTVTTGSGSTGSTSYISKITAGTSTNTIGGTNYTGPVVLFSTPIELWSGSLATKDLTSIDIDLTYYLSTTYNYEIILGGKGSTPATTDKYISMSFISTPYDEVKRVMLFRRVSRTNANYYESGTITLPFSKGNFHTLYIENISGATLSDAAVYMYGYRRLPSDPTGNVVSNINGYYFGGTNFDGKIVDKLTTFIANEALTVNSRVYSYSLANYLPNDGKAYIVSFSGWIRSNTGSSQLEAYILGGIKTTSQMLSNGFHFAQTDYHSTSTYSAAGTVKVYIPANDRNVTFFVHNKSTNTTTGQCALFALSYRRVGTNS